VILASFTNDVEEVFIAALFKNLGRILLTTYERDFYHQMMALVAQDQRTPEQASMQILGFRLDSLTEISLNGWNVPANVTRVLSAKPPGVLITPKNK